jgi:hypothetical protein
MRLAIDRIRLPRETPILNVEAPIDFESGPSELARLERRIRRVLEADERFRVRDRDAG